MSVTKYKRTELQFIKFNCLYVNVLMQIIVILVNTLKIKTTKFILIKIFEIKFV